MVDDDAPVGRILNRRRALAMFGAAGVTFTAVGVAVATADTITASGAEGSAVDCVAKPEMTEGPYYVDEGLNRSDIRIDTSDGSVAAGATLTLVRRVSRATPAASSSSPRSCPVGTRAERCTRT